MTVKTLVSKYVAREGYRFLFSGPMSECLNCRFRCACINNLREGVPYEVVKVYGIVNNCPALGEVVTVDVKPAEVEVALDSKAAVEGVVATYTHRECKVPCRFSELCRSPLVRSGTRVRVLSVGDRVACRIDRNLTKALVVTVTSSAK